MKTAKTFRKRVLTGLLPAALLSVGMLNFSSCNKYDLDSTDPDGYGGSIYSFLESRGNYTNILHIIDDLGYKDILNKTSSSTLFASSDEAYDRFFASNDWGVSNYSQLSSAQKKLLLKGSMIDNPYQVYDLSSIQNKVEGMCMRRPSSQIYTDTVPVIMREALPNASDNTWNNFWGRFNGRKEVVLFEDATEPPMLHFIENFMANNDITNEDYNFLFNIKDASKGRQSGDASVNGVKIISQNNRCSNGFVHEMEDVIMPLSNMAETIRKTSDLSEYNRLLERFSFPHYLGKAITDNYNNIYGTSVDSVFEKRFFSRKSQGGAKKATDDFGQTFSSSENDLLVFDPEWNTYYTGDLNGSTAEERMKNDMAVMLVPSNKALNDFWNASSGPGLILRNQYPGGIHTVPNNVISKLINNNMLTSFINSVPSKFGSVLNSNNDPMDITTNDIERVILADNGAIYVTNKVFAPTEYVSVLYPSTIYSNMSIMDWAIRQNEYNVYLNSLQAYYSLIIPTNKTLDYIDPLSVLLNDSAHWELYRFQYDVTRAGEPVYAKVMNYNAYTGEITELPTPKIIEDADLLSLRLRDILDACIVVNEQFDNTKKYYRTMGYQTIRVDNPSAGAGGMTVMGGRQINEQGNNKISVDQVYNQTKEKNGTGNGICYVLNGNEPIQGTFKSTMQMMEETMEKTGEMSEFYNLIMGNPNSFLETIRDKKYFSFTENINTFNTFHYTVYVPQNSSVRTWLQDHGLVNGPKSGWDVVLDEQEAGDPKYKTDSTTLANFVKYHFQDNSLFIGAEAESGIYSTAYVETTGTGSEKTAHFMKVRANLTAGGLSVQDYEQLGPVRHVLQQNGLYNIMAREYFFYKPGTKPDDATKMKCDRLYGASSIVLHLIDGPLLYKGE